VDTHPCAICGKVLQGPGLQLTLHEFNCYSSSEHLIPVDKMSLFLGYRNYLQRSERVKQGHEDRKQRTQESVRLLMESLQRKYG
jgi:hypothetical protein